MPGDGKVAKKAAAAAAAAAAASAVDPPGSKEEEEEEGASESGRSEVAGADAQAEAAQGGGATPPRLMSYGKRKMSIVARVSGVVDSVSVGEGGGHDRIFMSKPTGDEPDGSWTTAQIKMLWTYMEQAHRKGKQNALHAERYERMMRIGNGACTAPVCGSDHDEPEEHSGFAVKRKKGGPKAKGDAPVLMPEDVPRGSGLPKQEWQTRPLPESLSKELAGNYFLEIKDGTHDKYGNPYVVPEGKDGSYMGSFPHAICRDSRGRQSPGDGVAETSYYCSASNNIAVEVQLMQRRPNGTAVPASEVELMEKLQAAIPNFSTRTDIGYYETNFSVQLQLEFEPLDGEGADEDRRINPYHSSAGCAFKFALAGDRLLVPFEADSIYAASHYQVNTEMGRAVFKKFKMNKGTASGKLVERYRDRKYQFVARVTNPFFASVIPPAASVPFRVKSVFYNEMTKNERWVRKGDEIVVSPPGDVP